MVHSKFVTVTFVLLAISGCTLKNSGNNTADGNVASADYVPALAFQANDKIGVSLSAAEREKLTKAEQQALEFGKAGQEFSWQGERDAVSGVVSASRLFQVGRSSCRRFAHRVTVDLKDENATGTACRQEQGEWRLIK